ncbi:glycosyltransferase [Bacteroides helcogenes]|uniref:Glycosyl transferase family 2 n=1 Tax=Bacteroides helcogenes (strain ATCC 35417 / DSM 20613 / JCM 6297 / CCUG 15421 / P 36-108) TaxID=693979 RepID=E6SW48_BACT6|nr:glycosyltransferase [Bacteroides helcogenes]ADV42573.1 glycosyl transferase family 2 [Bacteroides helcogenes P 36-108]MDY5237666.1 glycosyltransferase [Bacteroides helcogenes]
MPKVSVIVPNYNHALYLNKRIDTVLAQSYRDFEVIILDDCSSDNSRDIIERYKNEEKVSAVVYNEVNGGNVFAQWDKGISMAKGDFIWIAESDDYADSHFLSATVAQIEQRKDIMLVFSASYLVDGDGGIMERDWNLKSFRSQEASKMYEGVSFVKHNMVFCNPVFNASMVLFRKSAYEAICKDLYQYKLCGDWLCWARIASLGKIIYVNRKLNYFRQHLNKVSPKAELQGLYYSEGYRVMEAVAELLSFSAYQRLVIKARMAKRLWANETMLPEYKKELIKHYSAPLWMNTFLYEFDKITNLSTLQRMI